MTAIRRTRTIESRSVEPQRGLVDIARVTYVLLAAAGLVIIAALLVVLRRRAPQIRRRTTLFIAAPLAVAAAVFAIVAPVDSDSVNDLAKVPYVQPGSVGYRGKPEALTEYPRGKAVPPNQGCEWTDYGLRCSGDDTGRLTLDHVFIHGGVYFTGVGTVTVTQSVIEGGGGSEWYTFYAAAEQPLTASKLVFRDSTLRWSAAHDYPSGYDAAPIWSRGAQPLDVQRCDVSGMPQGLGATSGSVIRNNYIHGLVQNSTDPAKPTHLDGIFSQGGSNILIQGNYVDTPKRNPSDVTAAMFFQNVDGTNSQIVIDSNFLRGGSFSIVNETVIGIVVTNNTFGGAVFGDISVKPPGSIGKWEANTRPDGSVVPSG